MNVVNQITEKYTIPAMKYWCAEHHGSDNRDAAISILSSIYQTKHANAEQLIHGSIRLIESKLNQLKIIKGEHSSTWAETANDLYTYLTKQKHNHFSDPDSIPYLITIARLQRNKLVESQKSESSKLKAPKKKYSQIVYDIGWSKLDPMDLGSVEDFKAKITNILFTRPEESPLSAGKNLLVEVMEGLSLSEDDHSRLLNKFTGKIEKDIFVVGLNGFG